MLDEALGAVRLGGHAVLKLITLNVVPGIRRDKVSDVFKLITLFYVQSPSFNQLSSLRDSWF